MLWEVRMISEDHARLHLNEQKQKETALARTPPGITARTRRTAPTATITTLRETAPEATVRAIMARETTARVTTGASTHRLTSAATMARTLSSLLAARAATPTTSKTRRRTAAVTSTGQAVPGARVVHRALKRTVWALFHWFPASLVFSSGSPESLRSLRAL